ncbi:YbjN domain-containing protein [Aliagarivorans marinus]|uniref:YbjN domain-containing protein n=1 Tax=Aliagarivorans marinus TaxID=561965 RepID=UPI0004016561|nr:YbjN domain-containing protein [Aliagarivorans marinus]
MKKNLVFMLFAMFLDVQLPVNAMELAGEVASSNPSYQPTRSAVQKAMAKMGYEYKIDSDGDVVFKMHDEGYYVYIIYDVIDGNRLWNLRILSQFSSEPSNYKQLLEFVNRWNTEKKYPKVYMQGRDTLALELNYPIEYGFNPDEFEDNVIGMFERTISQIADETRDMLL